VGLRALGSWTDAVIGTSVEFLRNGAGRLDDRAHFH
jgi:hypothetical protein